MLFLLQSNNCFMTFLSVKVAEHYCDVRVFAFFHGCFFSDFFHVKLPFFAPLVLSFYFSLRLLPPSRISQPFLFNLVIILKLGKPSVSIPNLVYEILSGLLYFCNSWIVLRRNFMKIRKHAIILVLLFCIVFFLVIVASS